MAEKILTYCFASNRTNFPVGKIVEIDGVIYLHKKCKNRHFLNNPPALCYDQSIIDLATSYNVELLIVVNTQSGITYKISMADFFAKSFRVSRGFGEQLGCGLENWATSGKYKKYEYSPFCGGQRAIPTLETPKIYQPSFFDIETPPETASIKPDSLFAFRLWVNAEAFETARLIS